MTTLQWHFSRTTRTCHVTYPGKRAGCRRAAVMLGTAVILLSPLGSFASAATELATLPIIDEEPASAVTATTIRTEPAPRISIDRTTIDLGDLPRGRTALFQFHVHNSGDAPLSLAARAPCGCTVVRHDESIAPGAAGQVAVELMTSAMRGGVEKHIELTTNDPDRPSLQLTISARVAPAIVTLPQSLPTLQLAMDRPTVQELRVLARAADQVQVTQVTCHDPYVSATLEPSDTQSEGREYQLTVVVQPEAPCGHGSLNLVLSTTAELEREVTLTVPCEKGIITWPTEVMLGQPASGGDTSGAGMLIIRKPAGGLLLQKIVSSDPDLQVTAKAVREGSVFVLDISHHGHLAGMTAPARITIDTNDPYQPQLLIPVSSPSSGTQRKLPQPP